MQRYLITTSHEGTWKKDCPIVFLGNWCCLYDRQSVWQSLNAVVADPFGIEIAEKKQNNAYIKKIFFEILGELAVALNAYHRSQHSIRYWHILLGHWLYRCISVAFNRYHSLIAALNGYDIFGTAVFRSPPYILATADSLSFIDACNNDVWNNVFYSKILFFLKRKLELDYVPLTDSDQLLIEKLILNKEHQAARRLARLADTICSKFSNKNDAFIISSYLPRIEELKLYLALGQFPQYRISPELRQSAVIPERRSSLAIGGIGDNEFENFFRALLPELIPVCYLEGYASLVQQVDTLPWPASPKFIFTANNFDTDELFKAWVASKAEKKIPYFVGQHGNYGVSPYMMADDDSVECRTPDYFITWGYKKENPKNIPAFNLKIARKKSEGYDAAGGILLIEVCQTHPMTHWDSYFEFGIYQKEQFEFASALPPLIKQALTVRLHGGHRNYRWSDELRWRDYDPTIQIETGAKAINDLIKKSRLVVHSYDSTGILETLALNVPTMCFWPGGLNHLLPSAIPYYDLLRSVGILADSSMRAAENVALHWGDVDKWWKSNEVQRVRKVFCDEYSRTDEYPVRTLSHILSALAERSKPH
jgi:putative transferase (TIGR04331 family)